MTPIRKLPRNVRDLGKLIVAKGFEKLPKVQNITLSGHTGHHDQKKDNKYNIFKSFVSFFTTYQIKYFVEQLLWPQIYFNAEN